MNRKNAIQTVFYIFCMTAIVGIFVYIDSQKTALEETLVEKENELSAMTQTLQEAVDTIDEQKETEEKLSAELATTKQAVDKLTTDVSNLTSTNAQLKANYTKLQGDYNTLKKNKAVAASKTNNKALVVSRSGNQAAAKEFYVSATAYTAYCSGCSGTTATGQNLRANPSMKVIAVDPRVIPLGSKVWVEGYGYAIAGDTGGAIKGSKIDLFMANINDAKQWGRKQVRIKVF